MRKQLLLMLILCLSAAMGGKDRRVHGPQGGGERG